MNISKFRNSYLIDKTYRLTLVSVSLPIVNAVSGLTMICERGAAVLAAGQRAGTKGGSAAAVPVVFRTARQH